MHVPPQVKTSVHIRHTIFYSAKISIWQEDLKKNSSIKQLTKSSLPFPVNNQIVQLNIQSNLGSELVLVT